MRILSTLIVAALALILTRPADAQPACCAITGIDARTGVVSAKVSSSAQTFQFKVADARLVRTLRVGQAVYANFGTNQVSLDGRRACCTITQGPRGGLAVRTPAPAKGAAQPASGVNVAVANVAMRPLPIVTYGEPVVVQQTRKAGTKGPRVETQRVTARISGRDQSADVLMIRGLDGIEKAPGLNEDARTLLKMHVKTLRPGESNSYIVDPRAAEAWMKEHPLPANLVISPMSCTNQFMNQVAYDVCMAQYRAWQAANGGGGGGGGGGSDCGNMFESVNCFGETVQDIGEGFTEGWQAMWEAANRTWDHWTGEMEKAWDAGASKGGASGSVRGTVRLGVPIEADFKARTTFFYIPCLPFVVRPRNITADGQITVGQQLNVAVEANGAFKTTLTIPPSGGPQIPVVVIPIIIGGIPVAVLDVSAYIEGEIDFESIGKATGQFTLTTSHRSAFDFTCDGDGCDGNEKGNTAPAQSNESAQIEGQVTVRPGIYTAVQLSLNYNVLSARAGPQPYLLGVASGCAAISASQTSGTTTGIDQSSVLTADLDWGAKLRAEALAGGQRIGKRWETKLMKERHIWFKDLAQGGSSALQPAVALPAAALAAQRTDFKVRMPSCYPYAEKVQYQISWTGGATPTGSGCSWQAGAGTCWFDPAEDLPFSLTWPNAGTYTISVTLAKDEHARPFGSATRVQHTVPVSVGGGGS